MLNWRGTLFACEYFQMGRISLGSSCCWGEDWVQPMVATCTIDMVKWSSKDSMNGSEKTHSKDTFLTSLMTVRIIILRKICTPRGNFFTNFLLVSSWHGSILQLIVESCIGICVTDWRHRFSYFIISKAYFDTSILHYITVNNFFLLLPNSRDHDRISIFKSIVWSVLYLYEGWSYMTKLSSKKRAHAFSDHRQKKLCFFTLKNTCYSYCTR